MDNGKFHVVVQWLRLQAATAEGMIQPLVRELSSLKVHGMAERERRIVVGKKSARTSVGLERRAGPIPMAEHPTTLKKNLEIKIHGHPPKIEILLSISVFNPCVYKNYDLAQQLHFYKFIAETH